MRSEGMLLLGELGAPVVVKRGQGLSEYFRCFAVRRNLGTRKKHWIKTVIEGQ